MKKIISIVLAFALVFGLAACGGTGGGGGDAGKVTGESYTWGNITVNCPEGMTPTNGSIGNDNDENGLTLQNTDNPFDYVIISVTTEDQAISGIEMSKEFNDGEDTEVTVEGRTWKGMQYTYDDKPVWQVYADVDGTVFSIMCAGYEKDSSEAFTVLSTIKHP